MTNKNIKQQNQSLNQVAAFGKKGGALSPETQSIREIPGAPQDFDKTLWAALKRMTITPSDARQTFIERLMAENKWTKANAEAAYAEYLRFLYLARTVDHVVTPSKTVDEVWHLHLTYADHYWGVLCGQIFKRRFEHIAGRGGLAEAYKHSQQYLQTIASYRQAFGAEPPSEIWPPPRFGRRRPLAAVLTGAFWSGILAWLWAMKVVQPQLAAILIVLIVAISLTTYFSPQSRAGNGSCGGGGCGGSSCGGGGCGGGD